MVSDFFLRILRLLQRELACLVPEVVVSGVKLDFPEVDVGHVRADLVQKVPIVGDDDDGLIILGQKIFEPTNRRDVQMVGRFIQKQNIGFSEKSLCEKDFHFLVVANLAHFLAMKLSPDSKTRQENRCVALGFPAIQIGEKTFEFARANAIGIREIRLGIGRSRSAMTWVSFGCPRMTVLRDFHVIECEVILPQERNSLARRDGDDEPL